MMHDFLEQGALFDEDLTQLPLFGGTKRRVILEGGFQDDWSRIHSVNPTEIVISDDVTRLNIREKIGGLTRRLTLVSIWQGTEVAPTDPLTDKVVEFTLLDYDGIQKVAIAIVDDGRVFFDLTLLEYGSPSNAGRLDRFIDRLNERTDRTNPVNLFFTPQGRERFNGTNIEIFS